MKKRLTEDELHALTGILEVSVPVIFNIREFLDVRKVRTALIREEFMYLSKSGNYQKKQIVGALMEKYGISKSYIELIIYSKNNKKTKRCTTCNRPMTQYKYTSNNGVCERCVVNEITNKTIIYNGKTGSIDSDENTSGSEHFNPLS